MTLPTPQERADGRMPLAFLAFLALMTSIVALTIDAVLPALDAIAEDLQFAEANDRQLVILAVFVGLGLAQPVFGPLADSVGRRKAAAIGWVIFLSGTLITMFATTPEMALGGRFLQGVGAAGPRIVATAIVRDLYTGRPMARAISLVMTVFMIVPMFAPLIGQLVESIAGWRAIFGLYLAMALIAGTWHLTLIPETLAPENKRALTLKPLAASFVEVLTNRRAMLYTLATTFVFGTFVAFLAAAQQIFEELYDLGPRFPWAFGALALCFAASQFANARLVMSIGMRPLCKSANVMLIVASLLGVGLCLFPSGALIPFWVFMLCMAPIFVATALLFSNLTALALEPLGHVAGTASAVVMSVSTLGSVIFGLVIARSIDATVLPIFAGFAALGAASLLSILAADRGSVP